MPRGPRLDAPGTLHHVIDRGIERRNIVDTNKDREDFTNRMRQIVLDSGTSIYAWALMNNHAHLLLRSGTEGLPAFMRRLLSGYASAYNRRHKRHGHLFQNRYKSIVCEEDAYFRELVRYIHLNPLRAGIVETLAKLDRYKWCGHCVIMNPRQNEWQDRQYVLGWFGQNELEAKRSYRVFVKKGIALGKRPELTGGGLIRSMGGWSIVKAMRNSDLKEESDARILGSGEYVSAVIKQAEENMKFQFPAVEMQRRIKEVIEIECGKEKVPVKMLQAGSRRPPLPKIRKAIALKLLRKYGVSMAETARWLGISTSGVAQIIRRNRLI